MTDPTQAVIMSSNGQLYPAQGLHPPPYTSYVSGNPPIKQEYTSSPTLEDQSREQQLQQQHQSQHQPDSNPAVTYSPSIGKYIYMSVCMCVCVCTCSILPQNNF